jgi:hypothetical protein
VCVCARARVRVCGRRQGVCQLTREDGEGGVSVDRHDGNVRPMSVI